MMWPERSQFRKVSNYGFALATELGGPLLRAYASSRTTRSSSSPVSWRKGLLLGAHHIGDILYRSGSLPALKRILPQCDWDIVAPEPASQVLEGNPYIQKIHRWDVLKSQEPDFFQKLLQENYDVALCYDSGMVWRILHLVVKLGIPNRIGYSGKGFSAWLTLPMKMQHPQPYPDYFRDMVAQLGNVDPDWSVRPLVYPELLDEQEADSFRQNRGLAPGAFACFFVSSRQPTQLWPLEYFIELARMLVTEWSLKIIVMGSRTDRAMLERMVSEIGDHAFIAAGDLSLKSVVCLLRHARFVVTPDSGPRHLANAANVPVFFFRNLRSLAQETGQYLDTEIDLVARRGSVADPLEREKILRSIMPAHVYSVLRHKIENMRNQPPQEKK